MKNFPFKCTRINEIVLRIDKMDPMITFYEEVIGLKLLRRFEDDVAFLQVSEDAREDIQTVTLFTKTKLSNFKNETYSGLDPQKTTMHHFALNVTLYDYEKALEHFDKSGTPYSTAVHSWIGWRSIFLQDPESNTVELVCYDKAIDRGDSYNYDKLYGDPHGEH